MIAVPSFTHTYTIHTCIPPHTPTSTAEGNKALLSPNQDFNLDKEGQEKKVGGQAQAKGKKGNDKPCDSIAEVGTVKHFIAVEMDMSPEDQ